MKIHVYFFFSSLISYSFSLFFLLFQTILTAQEGICGSINSTSKN